MLLVSERTMSPNGLSTGSYSLSVLDEQTESGPTVRHYRIHSMGTGGCYILPRKQSNSIPELVEYYKSKNVYSCIHHRTLEIGTVRLHVTHKEIPLFSVFYRAMLHRAR